MSQGNDALPESIFDTRDVFSDRTELDAPNLTQTHPVLNIKYVVAGLV
jgi:hypothetical protein